MDDTIKLLGYEANKALGYKAPKLYGHMAVNTELHFQILNLVGSPLIAEPISHFRKIVSNKWQVDAYDLGIS